MVIVEGPDGAGKTTVLESLATIFNLPIAARVVSKDTEAMVDLKNWVELNVSKGFQPLFFDRHRLISEPIYGSILRHEFKPGFDDVHWLKSMMYLFYDAAPILIYCLPPIETVLRNAEDQPDIVRENTRKIYSAYLSRAAIDTVMQPEWTIIYDYTEENADSALMGSMFAMMERRGLYNV